ncbi:PQQ-dependent sugar dehydrogenase [Consotaella aegiceratis]|uniref:PQQ-dependent sugar dehydrogenase n=1 Tax=Consotaella aegiceratis TaxID=3097961 RepID=UPI002F42CE5D
MRRLFVSLAAGSTLALAAPALAQTTAETAPPNAPDQTPAFENQTRAPLPEQPVEVNVETVAGGLPHLWSMEFLPDGRMLVTAKEGALYIVAPDGTTSDPIEGVPEVDDDGQGGLLDVALSPDFANDGMIYFSFSEPRDGGNGTSVARARLVEDGAPHLQDVEVIFRQMPTYDGDKHFGSRLAFSPDGKLYVTVGERSDTPIRDQAQSVESGLGKTFRINPDGSVPDDNPFVGQEGAVPEIWSYGHRNLQAATLGPDGALWTVEHGPQGGDELNHPQAGKNYGWPIITYGENYNGRPIGDGITEQEGMEQPVYYWDPVIAPSGMAHYAGDEFPEWNDTFLIGGLVAQGVVVLDMQDGRVASEQRIPLRARVRDVKVGPDGAVYAVTESRGGPSSILRLTHGG